AGPNGYSEGAAGAEAGGAAVGSQSTRGAGAGWAKARPAPATRTPTEPRNPFLTVRLLFSLRLAGDAAERPAPGALGGRQPHSPVGLPLTGSANQERGFTARTRGDGGGVERGPCGREARVAPDARPGRSGLPGRT